MSETGPGAVTGSRLIRGLILYVFNAVRNERDGARSGDWQQADKTGRLILYVFNAVRNERDGARSGDWQQADKRVDTLRLQCCSE